MRDRLEETSEEACDQAVIRSGNDPHVYALCLLTLAQGWVSGPFERAVGVSASPLRSSLGRRIQRIMDPAPNPTDRLRARERVTVVLAALLLMGVSLHLVTVSAASAPGAVQQDKAWLPWPGFFPTDGPGKRHGRDLFLLHRDPVLTELALSTRQSERLRAILAGLHQRARRLGNIWSGDAKRREAALAQNRVMLKQVHQQVATLLTANQMNRLHQIDLQQQGALALQEEPVARHLRLSSTQRQQIQIVLQRHRRTVWQLPGMSSQAPAVTDPKALGKSVRAFGQLHRRTQRQLLATLTPGQRGQFYALLGPTYPPLAETFLLKLRQRAAASG